MPSTLSLVLPDREGMVLPNGRLHPDFRRYLLNLGEVATNLSELGGDHGTIGGLSDDDHGQYHNDARGDARYSQLGHTHAYEPELGNPAADGYVLSSTAAGARSWVAGGGGGGVTDHGALTGLSDDDHTQYHNDARGDARYSQLGHNHDSSYYTEAEVDSALAGKANTSHSHGAGDISSGTLADARVAETNVTQHQAALVITESQISDLGSYAAASHSHVEADITDLGSYEPALGNPASDGYVLQSTAAGARSWVAQAGGGAAAPYCHLTKSGTQNVGGANGTVTYIDWDGTQINVDTGFTHSTGTNPSRVQVDADGRYQLIATVGIQQGGSARTTSMIEYRVNGTTIVTRGRARNYSRGSGYGDASCNLVTEMDLSNGDYIEVSITVDDSDGAYTNNTINAECELILRKVA